MLTLYFILVVVIVYVIYRIYSNVQKNKEITSPSFVAIDFETANNSKHSACQIGIAVVENGQIIDKKCWLIKPPSRHFVFTEIHGITYDDVKDKPTFIEIWPELYGHISNKIIACHYANFDIPVLNALCNYYKLPFPDVKVMDSFLTARKVWPHLTNHKLPTVAKHLNLRLEHHDAQSDAEACAHILIKALQENKNSYKSYYPQDMCDKRIYKQFMY